MSDDRATRSWASTSGLFIVAYHLGLLAGLPFYFRYHPPGAPLVVASVALLLLTQLGICAAYHRYYAHRGYTLRPAAEATLLFFATVALQGSALRWAFDHRLHHAHTDTDRDPYSVTRGFWHAHVLWLFRPSRRIEPQRVKDLRANRMVMFQHRHYVAVAAVANLTMVAAVGWLVGDWIGAFVLAGWTRLGLSHHLTWFINSLAHCWGSRTYSREHSAVDNHLLALLTFGEGYHNYHHTFPSDYRNGVRWYHFDPAKWVIWTLSKVGLAADLRRHSPIAIRRRLLAEDHKLLLRKLDVGKWAAARRQEMESAALQVSTVLHDRLAELRELKNRLAKRSGDRAANRALRREIRRLKSELRETWRSWFELCDLVLERSPT